jgi:DNA-binding transcriptional regulator YdaS (Cro superfamily)
MNKEIKNKILEKFGSQAELARWIGVSKTSVNLWFKGKQRISVPHALKLAKKLKVDWLDIREDLK